MKSKEEILESGILEQYVLGLTDEGENKKVEKYLEQFPDLKDHLGVIERTMETIAFQHAIVPPEELKEATMKKIEASEKLHLSGSTYYWKWISGIAAALAITAGLWGWMTNGQLIDTKGELTNANKELETLNQDCMQVKADQEVSQRLLALYTNEVLKPVRLSGNQQAPGAAIVAFWGDKEETAYLHIANLPPPPDGHTYQIWADVDGEMLPLGIFSNEYPLVNIRCLRNAESLNVTIEKSGGSDHPTVERLIMSATV